MIDYITITGKSPVYVDPPTALAHARECLRDLARHSGGSLDGITFTEAGRARFYDISLRALGNAIVYESSAAASQGWRLMLSGRACARLCIAPDTMRRFVHARGVNVTRVDYAFDIMQRLDIDGLSVTALQRAQDARGAQGIRMPTVNVDNRAHGRMLTVGSRTSDYYVRLYDKALEQGVPHLDWFRFEVELKRSPALNAVRSGAAGAGAALSRGALMLLRVAGDVAPAELAALSQGAPPSRYTRRYVQDASERWYHTTVIPAFKRFAERDRTAAIRVLRHLIDALGPEGDSGGDDTIN